MSSYLDTTSSSSDDSDEYNYNTEPEETSSSEEEISSTEEEISSSEDEPKIAANYNVNKSSLEMVDSIYTFKNKSLMELCKCNIRQFNKCLHLPLSFIGFNNTDFLEIYSIMDPLISILYKFPHTLRKLMGTCKSLHTYLSNYAIPYLETELFLIDALENNCSFCIKEHNNNGFIMVRDNNLTPMNDNNLFQRLTIYALKKGLTSVKHLKVETLKPNDIKDSALSIINHINNIELAEYLINTQIISDEVLIIIAHLLKYNSVQILLKKYTINKVTIKYLLPLLCDYHLDSDLIKNIRCFNMDEYKYFMEIIKKNSDIWSEELMMSFFIEYIDKLVFYDYNEFKIINNDEKELIVDYAIKKINRKLINKILTNLDIDLKYLLQIIEIVKENDKFKHTFDRTEDYIDRHINKSLNLTQYFNEQTIKNGEGKLFTEKLSAKDISLLIQININNKKLLSQCIKNILNKTDIKSVSDYIIQIMIDCAIENDISLNDKSLTDKSFIDIENIIKFCNINEIHMKQLIPIIYKNGFYHTTKITNLIENSKELTILSNNEASKYPFTDVYTKMLSVPEILQHIFKAKKSHQKDFICRLDNIKPIDCMSVCIGHRNIQQPNFIVKKQILPKHHRYANNIDYEDVEIYYDCKVKINYNNFKNTKLLVNSDETYYDEIINYVIGKLRIHNWKYAYDKIISFLIKHDNFTYVCPCLVLQLLRKFCNKTDIAELILNTHPFFKQFQ